MRLSKAPSTLGKIVVLTTAFISLPPEIGCSTQNEVKRTLSSQETNNRDLSAEAFITRLRSLPKITLQREPLLSEHPDAPIIIILADTHGSPEIELEKIEILYKELGITLIGVEGWAGKKADEERGKIVLNAESKMIEKLLEDNRFTIVGLEEKELQEQGLKMSAAKFYIRYAVMHAQIRSVEERIQKTQNPEFLPMLQNMKSNLVAAMGSAKEASLSYAKSFGIQDPKSEEMQAFLTSSFQLHDLPLDVIDLQPGESHESHLRRLKEVQAKIDKNMQPRADRLWRTAIERGQKGADKMQEAVDHSNVKRSIMVFGAAHIDDIIQELQKRGDFTIIVI